LELSRLIVTAVSLQEMSYTHGPGKFCRSFWATAWCGSRTGLIESGNVNEVFGAGKSKPSPFLVVL